MGRITKLLLLALCVAAVLAGCGSPDIPLDVQDLVVNGDGLVVDTGNGFYKDVLPPPGSSEIGQNKQLCLDNGTCIRIVENRRIEESTDNFATTKTVWEVDPNSSYWSYHLVKSKSISDPSIGVFDLLERPDGSVLAASGQLGSLERSEAGDWTPSVASLRQVSPRLRLAIGVLTAAVLALVGFGRVNNEIGTFRTFALACTSLWLIAMWAYLADSSNNLTFLATSPAILLTPFGVGMAIAASWLPLASRKGDRTKLFAIVPVGIAVLAAMHLLYSVWSRDQLGWLWFLGGCAAATAVGILVLRSPKPSDLTEPDLGSFSIPIATSYALIMTGPILLGFLPTWIWLSVSAFGAIYAMLWPSYEAIKLRRQIGETEALIELINQ